MTRSTRGPRVSVRGPGRAQLEACMAAREPFYTNGNLSAVTAEPGEPAPCGPSELAGEDLAVFEQDLKKMTYVVLSYDTPIAWVREDGTIHRVIQQFTPTTSRHQGLTYLLG